MGSTARAVSLRQLAWLGATLLAGAAALYFHYAEGFAAAFLRRAGALSPWIPAAAVTLGIPAICWLRDRVFPGTAGTGIPQAIAALQVADESSRDRILSLRVALGKTILLTMGLLCGATIGREGPSVHVAACLLHSTSRLVAWPRHVLDRGLILAGGAAGIGAAFNTPVAAIVFCIEEIGRSFEKENAGLIARTVIVACLLSWAALGDYLFYGRLDARLEHLSAWVAALGIGAVGGLLGGGFAQAVIWGAARVRALSGHRPHLVALALGLFLGLLGILSGGETYGGGFPQAQAALVDGRVLPQWYSPAKAVGSFLSLISGIPGGLFDPTLSVGAGLGQLLHPLLPYLDREALLLMAMAAYFAGVVQSPITAAVILVEMTAAWGMTLPLLATTIVAFGASRLICPVALYEALSEPYRRGAESDA